MISVSCQSKQNHVCIFSKKITKEIISVKVNARTLYAKNHWIFNESQLMNPDIFGALYTFRIHYKCTQTQFEDGARDVRVHQLTPIII